MNIYTHAFRDIIKHKYTHEEKIKLLQECIDLGADIKYGNSEALGVAVRKGDCDLIIFLINNGIDIHADNHNFLTACSYGNIKIIKLFLSMGVDVSGPNNLIITELMVQNNFRLNVLELLVENGANLFLNDNYLLFELCSGKCCFLESIEETNNKEDWSSYTEMVQKHPIDVLEYLIKIAENQIPYNKLLELAIYSSAPVDFIKVLLDHGADPNILIDGKVSLLKYSALNIRIRNCKILLQYGADINSCKNLLDNDVFSQNMDTNFVKEIIILFEQNGLELI